MKCLKLNKKSFNKNEGWDCPVCDWRKEIPRPTSRPTLIELKEWAWKASRLPLRPEEFVIIEKVIELTEFWATSIEPIVQSTSSTSIPSLAICRYYIRKLEGSEVFLPRAYNFFRKAAHQLAPLTTTPPPTVNESKLVKKPREKKVKADAPIPPPEPLRFSVFKGQDQGSPPQRILPSQPLSSNPPPQTQLQYPPAPVPSLQSSLPPRGIFAPPQVNPGSKSEERLVSLNQPQSCSACNLPTVENKSTVDPRCCAHCGKVFHIRCIAACGGRLYPQTIW
jgi:[histone H3]-trimethyl-L-lysine4 demethylase